MTEFGQALWVDASKRGSQIREDIPQQQQHLVKVNLLGLCTTRKEILKWTRRQVISLSLSSYSFKSLFQVDHKGAASETYGDVESPAVP